MTGLIAVLFGYAIALAATALFLYGLWHLARSHSLRERLEELARLLGLSREHGNPLLVSREHAWEGGGVMNPAAVEAGGRVHLFYRAVGADGVSRIGYASGKDGSRFDERLPYPVFSMERKTEPMNPELRAKLAGSGGTISGVGIEDPRAVVIDDTMFLSFSAFAGWDSLRIGVSSIAVSDLLNKRWKWTPPAYLSPEGQVHKNWVIFPEMFGGKYAVLHSLHSGSRDRVLVDYVDDLAHATIKSPYNPVKDESVWDSTLRGAGPPPIRTRDGWLLLYHATDAREPHRYKLGAMLLDLEDPSKVIARSPRPILEPDAWYENEGFKSGVVYACGAVVRGDTLYVYYGGADSVVCAAKTSLSSFLRQLKDRKAPKLVTAALRPAPL